MRRSLLSLAVSLCVLVGCRKKASNTPVVSPSGQYRVAATINRDKADQTKYLCLKLHLGEPGGKGVQSLQTGVSATMKWSLGWMPEGDVVVLYSSDVGTQAYKVGGEGDLREIQINDEIISRGKQLKEDKYGK